jgi:DNA-binding NarL/FixJ family response regulator
LRDESAGHNGTDERSGGDVLRLAIVDDYEVVVAGVARMFDAYADRIAIIELDANQPVAHDVDIALYDTFAQPEADQNTLDVLLANPHAGKVVVYTWVFEQRVVDAALAKGVAGYLSKRLPAVELVDALERIQSGERVVDQPSPHRSIASGDWPGREEGLSDRESEVLALIVQGRSNAEIAAMTYLSPNSIKSYIRSAYRKIGASSRTQAVLWGVQHGLMVERSRLDNWRSTNQSS